MNLDLSSSFVDASQHKIKDLAFGIDLGTTNSAISIVLGVGYASEIIRLYDDAVTLPSCVMWENDIFIVGKEAYKKRYQSNTIYSVKRLMGSGKTIILRDGEKELTVTPAFISSLILKELVIQASEKFPDIHDVVITVPAYFNDLQIKDTLEAGKLAGLNVLSILREPTSAALCYGINEKSKADTLNLVYDLGGGTFDVSLVRILHNMHDTSLTEIYGFEEKSDMSGNLTMTVLKNNGDMRLGGDDVDIELFRIVASKIDDISGLEYSKYVSREDKERLLLKLEEYKKSSTRNTYLLNINVILQDENRSEVKCSVQLTSTDFSQAVKAIYDRTFEKVKTVLQGNDFVKLDRIILVGGSTKLPQIKEFLSNDFEGVPLYDGLNPDEAVALGAGIQAKRLKVGDKETSVVDIIPLAIGIESEGKIFRMINKNQTVPFSVNKIFETTSDNQERLRIKVYQGNSLLPDECVFLGDLLVEDLPLLSAGEVKVKATLTIDYNGKLKCSVELNGNKFDKDLINVFGQSEVKNNVENKRLDKKIRRWTMFANKLDDVKAREHLLYLLEGLSHGEILEDVITDYISKLEVVSDISSNVALLRGSSAGSVELSNNESK